ncbi:MAG: hypothetical protein AAB225_04765 [Acidobacteriota bacterium]
MDLATKRLEVLFKPDAGEHLGWHSHALSPDGQWIAFRIGNDKTLAMTLAVMPFAGGPVRRLLTLERPDLMPYQYPFAFTPDGNEILFVRGRDEARKNCELWTIAVEGGAPRKAAGLGLPDERNLRVHPGGRQMAFRAGQRSSAAVFRCGPGRGRPAQARGVRRPASAPQTRRSPESGAPRRPSNRPDPEPQRARGAPTLRAPRTAWAQLGRCA